MAKINVKIADHFQRLQKQRAREDAWQRNRELVKKGILDQPRMREMHQTGFMDLLKTTLGNEISQQGLLRELEPEDLLKLARKANALRGQYQQGIKAAMVINAALPIDRERANTEIPWSHPTFANYQPAKKSLVVMFTTAASGKYQENKHFVSVEFVEFNKITGHWLTPENPKQQAQLDARQLKESLIKFDCDCGRHTYWYRFIASTGGFAYVGTKPLGREETGFPKIRNPQLKGLACKHVLRTMQSILRDKGTEQFLIKAILKQYKVGDSTKQAKISTTRRDFAAAIKRQVKNADEVLTQQQLKAKVKLLASYQKANKGMRHSKDKRSAVEKLNILSQAHDIEAYLKLIS